MQRLKQNQINRESPAIRGRQAWRRRLSCRATLAADYGSAQAQGLPSTMEDALSIQNEPKLKGLRVVLVSPKGPLNVGSVIRACANFECEQLYIVSPRMQLDSVEIEQMSVGSSHVRERIIIVESLASALSDTVSSIGFTRRSGASRKVSESLGMLLRETQHCAIPSLTPSPSPGLTALVFGREESGLEEEELAQCSYACAIPSGRIQPSLNLAAAVTVVLSNAFSVAEERERLGSMQDEGVREVFASQSEVEALLSKMKAIASLSGHEVQESMGGRTHGRKTKALGHLRGLAQRSRMTENEVRSLHGLASSIIDRLSPGHPLGPKRRIIEADPSRDSEA